MELGLHFEVIPSDIPENGIEGETHESYVQRIAELKAECVGAKRKGSLVIGADTVVVLGALRLGKPASREEARKMLRLLSGKRHDVMTGFAVTWLDQNFRATGIEKTGVWFKKLKPADVERYILSSEPYDKAGGYGIQGEAASFIEKIEGDISNVIGLPLLRIGDILKKAGGLPISKSFQPGLKAQAG
jgi:nucleoside triphosphate pyrophosphatase